MPFTKEQTIAFVKEYEAVETARRMEEFGIRLRYIEFEIDKAIKEKIKKNGLISQVPFVVEVESWGQLGGSMSECRYMTLNDLKSLEEQTFYDKLCADYKDWNIRLSNWVTSESNREDPPNRETYSQVTHYKLTLELK